MQLTTYRSERSLQRDRQRQRQHEALTAEQARKAGLSIRDAIEEAELTGDLKDILHRMAQHIGMEE